MNVRKVFWLIFILVVIVLGWLEVWWMAVALLATVLLLLAYRAFLRKAKRSWALVAVSFIFLVVLAVFLRVFVLEIYGIHTGSMMDTIVPGDYIIVSKLEYGPGLPRSPFEIPLINAFFSGIYPGRDRSVPWWGWNRLAGFSDFKTGDVMICRSPESSSHLAKRCVALPGDTIQIFEGSIYVNGTHHRDVPLVRKLYQMKFSLRRAFVLDSLNIHADVNEQDGHILVTLNEQEYQLVTGKKGDISFPQKKMSTFTQPDPALFRRNLHWEMDNVAPFVVPEKGLTVVLDSTSFPLYAALANKYEGGSMERRGQVFFSNGQQVSEYTFKNDYYFMLGDNRHDSRDSRVWGAVPEEYILGKADIIFFSIRQGWPRMDRILRLIR